MKNYIIFLGVSILIGAMSLGLGSCKKKEDTIAKITVRDTSDAIVAGARVILYGESTTTPKQAVIRRDTMKTNSAGVAVFDYNQVYQLGQAGVAILNIAAKKGDLKGEGILKIEEETENETTVYIQP